MIQLEWYQKAMQKAAHHADGAVEAGGRPGACHNS